MRCHYMDYRINDKWFARTLYRARAVGESMEAYFEMDKDSKSAQLHSLWISGIYMPHIDFRTAVNEILQTLEETKNYGTALEMAEVLLPVCLKYKWFVCLEIHRDKDYRFIGKDHDRDGGRTYLEYDMTKYYFKNSDIEENLKYWKQLMESDDVKLQNFLNKALLLGVMEI